jgi:pimeloyl-ACP methyl ester carboxylesterase
MPILPSLGPLEMSVVASDGLLLKGVLEYPDSPAGERYPLAVLAHQYPATADSWAPLVDDLLEMGVATLAFDLRGHGSSIQTSTVPLVIDTPEGFGLEPFGKAFMSSAAKVGFARIPDDILRVAGWGAAQNYVDTSRLLLAGASIGGPGVLLTAPRVAGLKGIVTFGAAGAPAIGDDADARVREAVRALQAPLYLASAEGDPFDGAKNARTWSEGVDGATVRIVPGAEHAMAIYYDVRDDVRRFIRQVLGFEAR